jgi:hypothetical protein
MSIIKCAICDKEISNTEPGQCDCEALLVIEDGIEVKVLGDSQLYIEL